MLGRFDPTEWLLMQTVFKRVVEQITCWLESGIEKAMNRYNGAVEQSPA